MRINRTMSEALEELAFTLLGSADFPHTFLGASMDSVHHNFDCQKKKGEVVNAHVGILWEAVMRAHLECRLSTDHGLL